MTKRKTPTTQEEPMGVTKVLTEEESPTTKQRPTKVAQAKMATKALAEEIGVPHSCVNCGQDWLAIQVMKRDDGTTYLCQLCEHEWDAEEMESPFWRNLGRK